MTSDTNSLLSLRDMIRWATSQFNRNQLFMGHGTDNSLDEAIALVLHVLNLDYSIPDNYLDCHLTDEEKEEILNLVRKRISTRKPLSYLTGKAYFAGLEFDINEQVLVPRSPIAELIQQGFHPWIETHSINNILDLCTGSGCIGIACAAYLPETHVVISDVSADALNVARKNIEKHKLANRVEAIESDVFSQIPDILFDVIVSNPPYVSEQEYQELPSEYHQEPKLGLTAGEDGMDIVSKILKQAGSFLAPGGIIIIEVGASADLLLTRYPNVPFNWIEFEQGGDGVFLLTHQELQQYQQEFCTDTPGNPGN